MNDDYSRDTTPLYFDALLPYIIALAIGALFVGVGIKIEIDGLRFAGTILDLICGVLAIGEIIAVSHKHITAINAERKRAGLPLIGKDARVIAKIERLEYEVKQLRGQLSEPAESDEPPTPIDVMNVTKTSPNSFNIQRKTYPDRPTEFFIERVFGSMSDARRIPSEDTFIKIGSDNGEWNSNQAKVWLGYLDEQGITKKSFESAKNNAPRMINPSETVDTAKVKFGYSSPSG